MPKNAFQATRLTFRWREAWFSRGDHVRILIHCYVVFLISCTQPYVQNVYQMFDHIEGVESEVVEE
jgi:hypothetical protein